MVFPNHQLPVTDHRFLELVFCGRRPYKESMLRIFLLLFVTLPLLELYVLIRVGAGIGGVATIALCLFTAALGAFLVRLQGLQTLLAARKAMMRGEPIGMHALHGAALVVAGFLLLTPGFITDTLGFLLLIPPLRNWLFHRFILPPKSWIDIEVIEDEPWHLP